MILPVTATTFALLTDRTRSVIGMVVCDTNRADLGSV